MFLNIIKVIIRICFYLILIGVCVTSWMKLLKEPTAFEEKIVNNQARLPSFTLCPAQPDGTISNKSIESFEDIEKAIVNIKDKYTIEYAEQKPYEQTKIAEKKYTDTLYGVWNFAPKISLFPPFEAVICLIWTPSIEYKLKPDWSYKVSCGILLSADSLTVYIGLNFLKKTTDRVILNESNCHLKKVLSFA